MSLLHNDKFKNRPWNLLLCCQAGPNFHRIPFSSLVHNLCRIILGHIKPAGKNGCSYLKELELTSLPWRLGEESGKGGHVCNVMGGLIWGSPSQELELIRWQFSVLAGHFPSRIQKNIIFLVLPVMFVLWTGIYSSFSKFSFHKYSRTACWMHGSIQDTNENANWIDS